MQKTLYLTVGLPRCGKSTWARRQGIPMVNPDSIRLALHGQRYVKEAEPMVWAVARYMVRALFLAGHASVILDATNTNDHRRREWLSSDWNVVLVWFDTDPYTCQQRAVFTNQSDLIPVIRDMAADLIKSIDGLTRMPDGTVRWEGCPILDGNGVPLKSASV